MKVAGSENPLAASLTGGAGFLFGDIQSLPGQDCSWKTLQRLMDLASIMLTLQGGRPASHWKAC